MYPNPLSLKSLTLEVGLVATWRNCIRICTSLLIGLLCLSALATESIGVVTMVIGNPEVENVSQLGAPAANARVNRLQKGATIQQGDTIKTAASDHVHIRFVDGGLVSVRPQSVLVIHEFRYKPSDPADSVIRITLERGEVRSISGAAAQAAKERFRLNTPLVAIGVKGTDFVTNASSESTRVVVNQGAIVMAPFDQNCKSDALGTCKGSRARELTAEMAGMALIYKTGFIDPTLQPFSSSRDNGRDKEKDAGNKTSSVDKQNLENNKNGSIDSKTPEDLLPQSRLIWGRWTGLSLSPGADKALVGDNLTIPFRDAMRVAEVTVGDGYYFIFREPGGTNFLPSLSNQADFRLTNSAAQYTLTSGGVTSISAASVDSGNFRIDFSGRTYSTSLNVSAAGLEPQVIRFSGTVDVNTGFFLGKGASGATEMRGALTLTGREAGYTFTQPVTGGKLSGATLWAR
jgi:FecR protein